MKIKYLQCVQCLELFKSDKKLLTCPNHDQKYSFLEIIYDYPAIKQFPEPKTKSWEKYLALLPVNELKISLQEHSTYPTKLINLGKKLGLPNLYLKDETRSATGSFKDKESLISVNKALEFGAKEVYSISSGNGAISASAYSSKAHLNCTCFVPNHTSEAKLKMIELFGGKISRNPGSYENVYEEVIKQDPAGWNITSGFNPYGVEGDKITSFEIWESIGVPDYIVVPCGNGGNLYGIWKGFEDLINLGLISKSPKMIGVQISGADPIKKALDKNLPYLPLPKAKDSIAEGIVATQSYASPKAVKAIKASSGFVITVSDSEILDASKNLSQQELIIPEITSVSAFAALPKLNIDKKSKIVVILTGTGLKYFNF